MKLIQKYCKKDFKKKVGGKWEQGKRWKHHNESPHFVQLICIIKKFRSQFIWTILQIITTSAIKAKNSKRTTFFSEMFTMWQFCQLEGNTKYGPHIELERKKAMLPKFEKFHC
jgi:hypothetical protein